jgi:beta-phosphoglucomutase
MFDAAIFDWDGTLADTRKAIVIAFQKTLNEIHIKVTDEYIERRIGIGAADTFRDVFKSKNQQLDEDLVKRLVNRKSEIEIQLADQISLFAGAKELLQALDGKLKMGLASMNNRSVILHLIKDKEVAQYFSVVLTAESISHSKPNPEILLKTAQKLDAKPGRCVVFEDSIFGVQAAKSAEMSCVSVTTGVYSKQELLLMYPDLVVASLGDKRIIPFVLR